MNKHEKQMINFRRVNSNREIFINLIMSNKKKTLYLFCGEKIKILNFSRASYPLSEIFCARAFAI